MDNTLRAGVFYTTLVLMLLFLAPDALAQQPGSVHANVAKGAAIFETRCSMCHAIREGDSSTYGPTLHGLFGRKAASLTGYAYSPDLRGSGIVWNAQTLDEYLADPHSGKQGVKMPYPGLSSKIDRANLIAFLEQATR